jgi:hypothetical protein
MLLRFIQLLRTNRCSKPLNIYGRAIKQGCGLDDQAPLDFVPTSWKSMVCPQEGVVDRAVWEICLLNSLSVALKSGNVNVPHGRAFQPVETYLLDREQWNNKKHEWASNPAPKLLRYRKDALRA